MGARISEIGKTGASEAPAAQSGAAPAASPANAIHLVRTTQQAHYTLSQMADQKASILMGATFVIFTITIGQAHGARPPTPLLILGGFAFLSAVLTVMAILPVIKAPKNMPLNLLFFGSFTQLDEAEYIDRLVASLDSDETVFRTMARDIYQNGTVLAHKKYKLIGYAYRVFLLGMSASLGSFVALHFL